MAYEDDFLTRVLGHLKTMWARTYFQSKGFYVLSELMANVRASQASSGPTWEVAFRQYCVDRYGR